MIKVIILGAGNVAQHLYTAFLTVESVKVIQCYNRKGLKINVHQEQNSITKNLSELKEADIYILAISDDVIPEISKQLPFNNRFVVHTSGSVPMLAIDNSNRKGVFYPLQTLSKEKIIDYNSIPFCIETEQENDLLLLKKLASLLSNNVYNITSKQRNVLHVAAVFVNNFTNYLFSIGNDICNKNNIPFEILHPLILETAKKIGEVTPDLAQTGPAIRNDINTIKRHQKILTDSSQKDIYKTLTKAIQTKYGKKL